MSAEDPTVRAIESPGSISAEEFMARSRANMRRERLDRFAMAALPLIYQGETNDSRTAVECYELAEAMLAESERRAANS